MQSVQSVEKLHIHIKIETCAGNPFMQRLLFPQTPMKQQPNTGKTPQGNQPVSIVKCNIERVPGRATEQGNVSLYAASTPGDHKERGAQASLPLMAPLDVPNDLDVAASTPGSAKAGHRKRGWMSFSDEDNSSPSTDSEACAQDQGRAVEDSMENLPQQPPVNRRSTFSMYRLSEDPLEDSYTCKQSQCTQPDGMNDTNTTSLPGFTGQVQCIGFDGASTPPPSIVPQGHDSPNSQTEGTALLDESKRPASLTPSRNEVPATSQVFKYPSPSSVKPYPPINPCYIKTTTRQLSSPIFSPCSSPVQTTPFQRTHQEGSSLWQDLTKLDKCRADKRKGDSSASNHTTLPVNCAVDLTEALTVGHKRLKGVSGGPIECIGMGTKSLTQMSKKHGTLNTLFPKVFTGAALLEKLSTQETFAHPEEAEMFCSKILAVDLLLPVGDCFVEPSNCNKTNVSTTLFCHEQLYTWASIGQPTNSMDCLEGRLSGRNHTVWPPVHATQQEQPRLKYTEADHQAAVREVEREHKEEIKKTQVVC
ncbi:formin-2-like [Ambystoma mexicanum]|uniref:formin-2-like n=1 Tax=Ambystoma mexicanum TaxID=8296 RepID=UPI0037E79937